MLYQKLIIRDSSLICFYATNHIRKEPNNYHTSFIHLEPHCMYMCSCSHSLSVTRSYHVHKANYFRQSCPVARNTTKAMLSNFGKEMAWPSAEFDIEQMLSSYNSGTYLNNTVWHQKMSWKITGNLKIGIVIFTNLIFMIEGHSCKFNGFMIHTYV